MGAVAEEHRALQETVARFVARELVPLEATLLAREAAGGYGALRACRSMLPRGRRASQHRGIRGGVAPG